MSHCLHCYALHRTACTFFWATVRSTHLFEESFWNEITKNVVFWRVGLIALLLTSMESSPHLCQLWSFKISILSRMIYLPSDPSSGKWACPACTYYNYPKVKEEEKSIFIIAIHPGSALHPVSHFPKEGLTWREQVKRKA